MGDGLCSSISDFAPPLFQDKDQLYLLDDSIVFERLENDLNELRAQKSALARARLLAAGQKDIGLSSLAA